MSSSPSTVFVGRTEQLALIEATAAGAANGRSRVVVLDGPAGSGKSALLNASERFLDGFTLVRVECDDLASGHSMWLANQLHPVVGTTPFDAGLELLSWLNEMQEEGPVALIVEDLHWCDAPSRQALLTVLRRLEGDRVIGLVTTRPEGLDQPDGWQRLVLDTGRCEHVELGELSVADLVELADAFGIALGPSAARRLHEHTGGHALHVRTLLREIDGDQLNSPEPLPAPRTLALTVAGHVAALPRSAADLISALAVTGPTSLHVLSHVAELDDPTRALEDALPSGLVDVDARSTPAIVRFAHPLYRTAVYEDLAPTVRRRFHLAAAEVSEPGTALDHRVAAADRSDDALAAELEVAAGNETDPGRIAERFAAAAAVSSSPEDVQRRLVSAGRVLRAHGHIAHLGQLADRLATSTPTVGRAIVLGFYEWQSGSVDAAEETMRHGLTLDSTPAERAELLLQLGRLYVTHARGAEAIALTTEALDLGALPPQGSRLAAVILVGGSVHTVGGPMALDILERHLPSDDPGPDDPSVDAARALTSNYAARPTATLQWAERLDRVIATTPSEFVAERRSHLHVIRAESHFQLGSWDDALIQAHTALDLATDDHQRWVLPQAHSMAAMVHAGRGRFEEAERHLQRARLEAAAAPAAYNDVLVARADAVLGLARRRPAEIVGALAPLTDPDRQPPMTKIWNLQGWSSLIAALIDLGQLDGARAELDRYSTAADERGFDVSMERNFLDARLFVADSDSAAATTMFDRAVASCTPDHAVLDRIELFLAYGRHLRAAGRRREASSPLAAGRELAAACGAKPFLEQFDTLLLGRGRHSARLVDDPLASLTDRERDVVTLVATGQTNKEAAASLYVSVKSIEYHLGNSYAKLGVRSRKDLTALLAG